MKAGGMSGTETGTPYRKLSPISDAFDGALTCVFGIHSATTGGEGEGRGHNGGVWEWTSTVFDKREGFEPSALYPGFSADFFDTLHNVVVRGMFHFILFTRVLTKTAESLVDPTPRFRVKQNVARCATTSSAITLMRGLVVELCTMSRRTKHELGEGSREEVKAGKVPNCICMSYVFPVLVNVCVCTGALATSLKEVD